MIKEKRCKKCGVIKSLSEFYPFNNSKSKVGIQSYCKDCQKKYYYEWKKRNIEKLHKYSKEYYLIHQEKIKKVARRKSKKFYAENSNLVKNRTYKRLGTLALKRKGICKVCGFKGKTEGHHILPRWFSHDDSESNLIEVCRSCHARLEAFIIRFLLGKFNEE